VDVQDHPVGTVERPRPRPLRRIRLVETAAGRHRRLRLRGLVLPEVAVEFVCDVETTGPEETDATRDPREESAASDEAADVVGRAVRSGGVASAVRSAFVVRAVRGVGTARSGIA